MKRISPRFFCVFAAAAVLTAAALVGCTDTAPAETKTTADTPTMPVTAAPAVPDAPPTVESYPMTLLLDDGTEVTVTLPRDPELLAELHLCAMSGEEILVRAVICDLGGDMGHPVEEVYAFSGDDGSAYRVVSPAEILNRYVTLADAEDAYLMTVSGAEYQIPKAQFAETDILLALPDPARSQNFYVENGQLFCRVSFLCDASHAVFAAETLKIRYDLTDGVLTAAEITFERPSAENAQ